MPRWLVAVSAASCVLAAPGRSAAAHVTESPTPAPTATPAPASSAPSDPCTTIIAIVTRPTVTTSVCTVRPQHLLVENGWTNTVTTGPGGGNTATYPQSFVRIGTDIRQVEIDWTPPSYNRSSVGGAIISGASDMAFGAKWEAGYDSRAVWGCNASVSVPSGDTAFTAGTTQYMFNLNGSYTLTPVFSLSSTLGFNSLGMPAAPNAAQRYFSFIPTLALFASTSRVSEAFAEYAYFSRTGPGLPGKSLIDFGYEQDLGRHLQLDAEYGFTPASFNGQRQQYVGAGVSFMFGS
ncbi:MAG: hypothetical protein JO293_03045 [Candidatus Eremiobacteraeota bacterium]|nr:hypothetical protein [Candidatus Eremiobacteraeota bacterium]